MLQLTDIQKAFVHQTVLEDVSLQVGSTSRVGLIGRNGCGKSTLLSIIMGVMEADEGSIYRAPGLKINWLRQEPQITPGNTLEQELKSVFTEVNALLDEEAKLLPKLETLSGDDRMKALNRLDGLHQELVRLDAASIDAKIGRMITGLGFSREELSRPVELFSGGWQMRINLAKVLLAGADILLLDEPTNHLDLETCAWLEEFLKTYPGGLVIVSHDRHFLDQLATEIAEIELGRLTLYPGNYSRYVTQKAEARERLMSAAHRQDKELARQTAFVERFRASATKSTQAKSREKQLNKVVRIAVPQTNDKRMTVRFPVPQASGKQVVTLRKLAKAYDENQLFQSVDADLQRYQRVFLLGANGCGKTTLLRLILGLETAEEGEVRLGHQANLGYFSQHQLETLDPNVSVFDTIHNACPKMTQTEVRGLLGRLLFSGDEVFKPASVLSGGEKSKLALAKLMLSGPNTLLLDEPTNHMDIPAREVLEEAFREFEGTMLCISHDRFFIEQLATDIWEIHEGKLLKYPGGYAYYLGQRDAMRQAYQTVPVAKTVVESLESSSKPVSQNLKKDQEKQIKKLEKQIIALESELESLQVEATQPDIQQDYVMLQKLGDTIRDKQHALDQANAEWETLVEQLTS